ncbi:MAG: DUF192 domain-containing protein [Synechococcus sp.]
MSAAKQLNPTAMSPLLVLSAAFAGLSCLQKAGLAETLRMPTRNPQVLPIEAQWCLKSSNTTQPPVCINLEVADNDNERRLGLMHRPPLPPQRGMWFDFPQPAPISMWMLNTPAMLDMVFIHNDAVVAIEARRPTCRSIPCPSYFADRDQDGRPDVVDGVIELGAGEAARLGIGVGDRVVIESSKAAAAATPGKAP